MYENRCEVHLASVFAQVGYKIEEHIQRTDQSHASVIARRASLSHYQKLLFRQYIPTHLLLNGLVLIHLHLLYLLLQFAYIGGDLLTGGSRASVPSVNTLVLLIRVIRCVERVCPV